MDSTCRNISIVDVLLLDEGLGGALLFGRSASIITNGVLGVDGGRGLDDGVGLNLPVGAGGVSMRYVSGSAPRCDTDGERDAG